MKDHSKIKKEHIGKSTSLQKRLVESENLESNIYKRENTQESIFAESVEGLSTVNLLAECEGRYRTLIENINDVLCIHDLKGNIIDVNKNACIMTGYAKDEFIGSNISKIANKKKTQSKSEKE